MVKKDKKATSEKQPNKLEIPFFTSPLSEEVVSSIYPSSSVPLSAIPPDLDNQTKIGPNNIVKATAMDALVIQMAEKNLQSEPDEEKPPENPVSSGLKKIGKALGISTKEETSNRENQEKEPLSSDIETIHKQKKQQDPEEPKKESGVTSFINVMNEGLNSISKNSREKKEEAPLEEKTEKKGIISSAIQDISETLGISPNKDKEENEKDPTSDKEA